MQIREMLDPIADKIGFSSIAATVGITTAQQAEIISKTDFWLPNAALIISAIGGIFFIYRVYLEVKVKKLEQKIKEIELKKLNLDE